MTASQLRLLVAIASSWKARGAWPRRSELTRMAGCADPSVSWPLERDGLIARLTVGRPGGGGRARLWKLTALGWAWLKSPDATVGSIVQTYRSSGPNQRRAV